MAIETATANAQHYEVGTGVLQSCLGPRMKYSCCLYPTGSETLGQAEIEMLDAYVDKADLKDGMKILDLGYDAAILDEERTDRHSAVAGDLEPCILQRFSLTRRSQRFPIPGPRRSTSISKPAPKG